jgi:hypothetical protein
MDLDTVTNDGFKELDGFFPKDLDFELSFWTVWVFLRNWFWFSQGLDLRLGFSKDWFWFFQDLVFFSKVSDSKRFSKGRS